MRAEESLIEVFEPYSEGLLKIEYNDYLEVYFYFNKAETAKLTTHSYSGEFKGIFATRSSDRPSAIGSTIVKLIERKGNVLKVLGLDALDGTPVIDLKPIHIPFTEEKLNEVAISSRKMSPRKGVLSNVWTGRTDLLLLDAAELHGHFCTGLALGIMMATKAMQMIRNTCEGLDSLSVIVEKNDCSLDGIQFVTGCTFGNNKLTLNETGSLVMILTKGNDKAIKISLRPDAIDYMKQESPQIKEFIYSPGIMQSANSQFARLKIDQVFGLLTLDFDRIFEVMEWPV
ncbi:MAG: SAM-dependent methyltransferase [Bacteroidales bacterium]|nr:SAM-dependent methyltransferase [Bacteroidales bacterium]